MTAHPLASWTSSSAREAMPDTVMARAFLAAVMAWAGRESHARRATLPTGAVDADELRRVVIALACAPRGALKEEKRNMSNQPQGPEREFVRDLLDAEVDRCTAELAKRPRMRDRTRWLKRAIAGHNLVIGVFPDDEKGWGYYILKGESYLAACMEIGWKPDAIKAVAVPCPNGIEEAKAMQREFVPVVN